VCALDRAHLGASRIVDALGLARAGLRDRLFSDAALGPKLAGSRPGFRESLFDWLEAAWVLSRL